MHRIMRVSSSVFGFLIALLLCASPRQASAQNQKYYADWWCSGQRQCEAVMGKSSGTAGPFDSSAECEQWRRTYILTSKCNGSGSGGGGHSNPGPIPFPQSIIVYPVAVAGLATIFGQGGAELGGGITADLVVAFGMRDHSISRPVAVILGTLATATAGVGVARVKQAYDYPNPACEEVTAEPDCPVVAPDAPAASITGGALIGGALGFVSFMAEAVAVGPANFRTLPGVIRALARLHIRASSRGVSGSLAW